MESQLKLKAKDLRWAAWRNTPPEPRPQVPNFDVDEACEKITAQTGKSYNWTWKRLKLSPVMSRPEAHFWLEAMHLAAQGWNVDRKESAAKLRGRGDEFDGSITDQHAVSLFSAIQSYRYHAELVIPLYNLLETDDFIGLFVGLQNHYHYHNRQALIVGFHQYILPYITEEERRAMRAVLKPNLAAASYTSVSMPLAALLGGFDTEIEAVLNKFIGKTNYGTSILAYLTFGLSDPKQVKSYIRQLQIPLTGYDEATAWIAHTELTALDWLVYSVLKQTSKQKAGSTFRIFKSLKVLESVPHILELWDNKNSQVKPEALAWLTDNPELVANTLTPLALSDDKQAKIALHYLRRMVTMGQVDALNKACETLDIAQQDNFRDLILEYVSDEAPEHTDETTPDWLKEATKALLADKRKKKVLWVDTLNLPPLTVEGRRLNQEQLVAVLVALFSKDTPMFHDNMPMLQNINDKTGQPERDDFVWALFQMWLEMGAPSKDKWAFYSLGKLGSDGIVMKLTPLIRKWPGESKHQRAKAGLDILREIGTDTALMQINSIAQKIRYKSLKKHAKKSIQEIAKARGLTQGELEDRIIPDCGLDEHGQRVFDYGRRQFTFALTGDMKPMVKDEKGKLKSTLPKPGKTDDDVLAPQARSEWNLIKKQIKEVAKVQAIRLESGMVSQRRWKRSDFEQFYLQHPLMVHIIRLLIWGGYDADGQLVSTFRVTEDRELVDTDDETLTLANVAQVGVLHPMEIEATELQPWGEVLSDYEIISPFEQLSRPISRVEPNMEDETEITRFADAKVEAIVLVSILDKSGWERGSIGDGGMFYGHSRYYPFADVTAIVTYEGVPIGYYDWDDQSIETCYFVQGKHTYLGYSNKKDEYLKLGDVPPVVYSETLRTLHAIAGKSAK